MELPKETRRIMGRTCKVHTEKPFPVQTRGAFQLRDDSADHYATVLPQI